MRTAVFLITLLACTPEADAPKVSAKASNMLVGQSASITLAEPGQPEAAASVDINFPEGVFGNPNAVPTCTVSDLALSRCPLASQVGTVTLHANYLGDPGG